jgi:hypothetical protein
MFYFFSILALALFDIVATHYHVVTYRTFDIEANPVMRWVMESFGMQTAYIVRMVSTFIAVVILLTVKHYNKKLGLTALRIVFAVHILLAGYHVYISDILS